MSSDEIPLIDIPPRAPPPFPAPVSSSASTSRPSAPRPFSLTRLLPGLSRAALRDWLIDQIFGPAFRPRASPLPNWQWADANHIPVEGGGRYLSRRKPHCRTFAARTTDPTVREQHVAKASRAGYTQVAINRIAQIAADRVGNVQFTCGSLAKSKDVNRDRLIPILEYLSVIGNPEDDPDDASSSRIRIDGMRIRISGAFTRLAFTGDMVYFLVNDESDAVPDIAGIGSPADGGRSRIRGIDGAQLVSISRPGEWGTPHHRDVASGTLEFFAVPCPHCGTFQELTIDGRSLVDQLRIEDPLSDRERPINRPLAHRTARLGRLDFSSCKLLDGSWDFNRILTETRYQCVAGTEFDAAGRLAHPCLIDQDAPLPAPVAQLLLAPEAPLPDTSDYHRAAAASLSPEVADLLRNGHRVTCKLAMVLSGRHLSANPWPVPAPGGGPRSKRSEHNSDLISLDFDMTWGHLASDFAQRAHDPAALRNFLNEHGGLPSRPGTDIITDRDLIECRAPYERGTIPFDPDFVTLCADTQDAYWKFVVAAGRLSADGQSWRDIAVVDWGVAVMKSDLLALLPKAYPIAANPDRAARVINGLVDLGGHRTDEVYELHFLSNHVLFPCKGTSDRFIPKPTWQKEIGEGSGWRGVPFDICWYLDDHWQHRLVSSIRKVREIKECVDRYQLEPAAKGLPPRLWIPGVPADAQLRDFEKELLNETLVNGKWTKLGPQDFRDALKESLASFDLALPSAVNKRAARLAAAAEKKSAASSPPP